MRSINEFGIAAIQYILATVNYHLQKFLIIGLVAVNQTDNKTYYKLNKETADKYIELLRKKLNL